MKATLTHNNAYDSIVITDDEGKIVAAAQITGKGFSEFHGQDPDFADWPCEYSLNIHDDIDDYGDAYVERTDCDNLVILDEDLYLSRKNFFRFEN